ncbi:FRG domain-containing protein [Desulfovibrio inopinatus]|uniref:FRG domain-containing protein n=1 Tax=Desulfovibrio inopinatus TaxID=102109 RepID=UPI0009FE2AAD|nr:FRG domain-containing protein [Desulfovibrio inopinatus]
MSIIEQDVESWENLIEILYERSWQEDLKRYRSNYVFRGLTDRDYNLQTSLRRLDGPFAKLERHLLRNFRKYAPLGNVDQYFSDWKWLTIGQHHGLPTRFLDWTYSPFVALHFATANIDKYDKDGVVWCVDFMRAHQSLPEPLKKQQEYTGSNAFTLGMLERAAKKIKDFDTLSSDPFVVFYEPPSMDERIVNQFALFSVMSDPATCIDDWLSQTPNLAKRIIIPSKLKWEIRDKLDQANITERVLFPGLDGLAAWLRRHYSPTIYHFTPGMASSLPANSLPSRPLEPKPQRKNRPVSENSNTGRRRVKFRLKKL